jgi:hypothetical protein
MFIGATCGTHNALLTPAAQWKLLAGRHRSSTPFPLQQELLSHTGTFPHRPPAFFGARGRRGTPSSARVFFALSGGCLWLWTPTSTAFGSTRPTSTRISSPMLRDRAHLRLPRPTTTIRTLSLSPNPIHRCPIPSGAVWASILRSLMLSPSAARPASTWPRIPRSRPARFFPVSTHGSGPRPLLSLLRWRSVRSTLPNATIPPGWRRPPHPRQRLCLQRGVRLTVGPRLRSRVLPKGGPVL